MATGFDDEIKAVLDESITAFPSRVKWNGAAYTGIRSAVDFGQELEEGGLHDPINFNLHLKRTDFPRSSVSGQPATLPQVNEPIEVDGRIYRIVTSNDDEDDPELRLGIAGAVDGV